MNSNNIFIKEPCLGYDDSILYGKRVEIAKFVESSIKNTASECVHHFIKCSLPIEPWSVQHISRFDLRLQKLVSEMELRNLMPIQRYSFSHVDKSPFPVVFVSPSSTGKTSAIILYILTKIIAQTPSSTTEDILYSHNNVNTFKISDLNLDTRPILKKEEEEQVIDQDNFDFNSLGKDPQPEEEEDVWGVEACRLNLEKLMIHPKYIVVSYSQQQVEAIDQEFERVKLMAYDNGKNYVHRKIKSLNPVVKTVNIHQDDSKLALKCTDTEVLLTTPLTLLRCLKSNFIVLNKCDKIFFDDFDLSLQLHSSTMREIIKIYLGDFLSQPGSNELDGPYGDNLPPTSLHFFSRKWTELVNKCINTVSLQSAIVFGSSMEAALYANVRIDLEFYDSQDESKQILMNILTHLSDQHTTAVMCCSDEEALELTDKLTKEGYLVRYFNLEEPPASKIQKQKGNNPRQKCINILSDSSLGVLLDSCPHLSFITCLIHYSTPNDMTILDQRFRIMHHHLREMTKNLSSTILLKSSADLDLLKALYDLVSRSSNTLNSSKLALKNLIDDKSVPVCWRWASTGICRLEKYSRNDKFGSYCPYRHSLLIKKPDCEPVNRWPTVGQCKITITNLISPNEFYFCFEAHRGENYLHENWVQLEESGVKYYKKVQEKLDFYKNAPTCSVPLNKFKIGKIYGVYFHQETRVDRVKLLEIPFKNDEPILNSFTSINLYSKTTQVLKVDYGLRINVYLRNLFELPHALANIEPLCHRGVHIGYKPTGNEHDWWYKAKKFFYDQVSAKNITSITAWVRLNSNRCFWFEDMLVSKKLESNELNDCKISTISPHHELSVAGFATKLARDPTFLPPSQKLAILSRWHIAALQEYVNYAFLRKDKPILEIFVLDVTPELALGVRSCDYNKMLIDLEDTIMEDYKKNRIQPLNYFAKGVYCLAKIRFAEECVQENFSINRCIIEEIKESKVNPESTEELVDEYYIKCLDHHDNYMVSKSDLYLAHPEHLSRLPFQAITCHISKLNPKILEDTSKAELIHNLILGYSRAENNQLRRLYCILDDKNNLNLLISIGKKHEPLDEVLKREHGIELSLSD